MKLIVKYNRKDFFGNPIYTEDYISVVTKEHFQKTFRFFKDDSFMALQINDNECIFWNSYTDFENKFVTVRTYENVNSYTDTTMPFNKLKRKIYKSID